MKMKMKAVTVLLGYWANGCRPFHCYCGPGPLGLHKLRKGNPGAQSGPKQDALPQVIEAVPFP